MTKTYGVGMATDNFDIQVSHGTTVSADRVAYTHQGSAAGGLAPFGSVVEFEEAGSGTRVTM